MAFGSALGKVFTSIPLKVNPSLLTPKLATGFLPTTSNPLSALLATAPKNSLQNLTPAQIAAVQALLKK
ncbi:hypothetical protein FHX15_001675 [Rhizobium sp. BK650]|uniref:hypothetical protein n=1 Tax=Rhizobium sp. BK650 TaxID=2586990 RepID=UPI00160AFC28|nr:hypothetical protein [Rhizobium sp. BK650]MBB3656447.1 hypothetical protein [Rhizobium sp. BK650]